MNNLQTKKKQITNILIILLSETLQNYNVDIKPENKIFESLINNMKQLNDLLNKNSIFYNEFLTENEAKKSIKQLDNLHNLFKSAILLIKDEFPEKYKKKINNEYEETILHFNNEYAGLTFQIEKNQLSEEYKPEQAISKLKELINV